MVSFQLLKSFLTLRVPLNFLFTFRSWKKGRHFSEDHEIKRFKAAIHPVSLCTYLLFLGEGMLMNAFICSRLASIPHRVMRYLRNLPYCTPNEHLRGLSFILYSCKIEKHSSRWAIFGTKGLDQYVIDVDFHYLPELFTKHGID